MTSIEKDNNRRLGPSRKMVLALIVVIFLDYAFIAKADHWMYMWPGRMHPFVFPIWTSFPRFFYYFLTGMAFRRILDVSIKQALIVLLVIFLYYCLFRIGVNYIYGGLYSYLIAYLPLVAVPAGFIIGYFLASLRENLINRRGPFIT